MSTLACLLCPLCGDRLPIGHGELDIVTTLLVGASAVFIARSAIRSLVRRRRDQTKGE